ncbi:MAG: hypothetical protein K2G23_04395, partial [Muribaculaceae bacterium]|nr:hypothetical protein [Muribaculaceae bacterium]
AIKDLEPVLQKIEEEINKLISGYAPVWKENPDQTLKKLLKDSRDYQTLIDAEHSMREEISETAKGIAAIREIERDILETASRLPDLFDMPRPAKDQIYLERISRKDFNESGKEWRQLSGSITVEAHNISRDRTVITETEKALEEYYIESHTDESHLIALSEKEIAIPAIRKEIDDLKTSITSMNDAYERSKSSISIDIARIMEKTGADSKENFPLKSEIEAEKSAINAQLEENLRESGILRGRLDDNSKNKERLAELAATLERKQKRFEEWDRLNRHFGGTRFRTLVQSHILRPLLRNANIYLRRITDHFILTCSEQNEQLSILVLDRYNKNKVRSATVLSGGERFMISLALSLALSAMNKKGLNVDILFIDEGFGTLDAGSLNAVIDTLRRLPEIAAGNGRRVGVISHREELSDCIDVQIQVKKCGEGRSRIEISGNN